MLLALWMKRVEVRDEAETSFSVCMLKIASGDGSFRTMAKVFLTPTFITCTCAHIMCAETNLNDVCNLNIVVHLPIVCVILSVNR